MACCHYDVGDIRRDAPEQSKCLAAGWAQYRSGRCSFICRLHPRAFLVVTLRHTCGMEYWSGLRFGIPAIGSDLASLWTTGIAGRDTILGGGYGPEGGLLATFIFASSALFVQRQEYFRSSLTARSQTAPTGVIRREP